jgi:hypothetical protein
METPIPENLTFEMIPFTKEDSTRLESLVQNVFGLSAPPGYLSWKYMENPSGACIAHIVERDREPVAFYCAIPERFRINGRLTTIYQACDAMTLPAFRRSGLFSMISKKIHSEIQSRHSAQRIFSIPGSVSLSIFQDKFGFRCTGIPFLFCHKNMNLRRKSKIEVELKPLRTMTAELEEVLNGQEPSPSPIAYVHDAALVQYRIFRNPLQETESFLIAERGIPCGYVVYKRSSFTAKRIVPLLLCYRNFLDYQRLTASVIHELFRVSGADWIYTWCPPAEYLRTAYRKAGFLRNVLRFGPLSRRISFCILAVPEQEGSSSFYEIEHWDFQPVVQDYIGHSRHTQEVGQS